MSYLDMAKKVLAEMRSSEPIPTIPPPPGDPIAEAQEIARRLEERGICLIWAETVKDFIAFVSDDFDRRQVPAGFVIYTESELRELFGDDKCPSDATLHLIHEAKKIGGSVAKAQTKEGALD